MNYHVLTLFPEMITGGLGTSITGRAIAKGTISVNAVDIRNFSENKHFTVDDYPYGGGAGMVMQAGPVYSAYQSVMKQIEERSVVTNNDVSEDVTRDIKQVVDQNLNQDTNQVEERSNKPRVIYVTPQGKTFSQSMAEELAKEEDLVILCGHYEGIDERVLEMVVTDYVSIGDYVLTGGELPAMVMIDAISRLVPGVLNNKASAEFETFQDNLLEYPQYTRPEEFMGRKVPEVLLSGHHGKIDQWRREQSIIRTLNNRPDLLENANLSKKEQEFLSKLKRNQE